MTIGDDIFTILGMMPIRDRAGIQRATMADEAMKASGGNAEGQALTQQGQRPPPISLPPMGGPPPQGDVQLPNDVPTAYAAGKSAKASPELTLPPPTERTIASSPAANPSPEVTRGSDMILRELQNRKRQEEMNGLFASIALAAGSLRGGGGGDDGSRNALIEQAFGGGKQMSIAELIALQKMRGDENTAINEAGRRKQAIDTAMRMFGYGPELAALKYDNGTLTEELKPENMRKRSEDERAGRTRMDLAKPEVIAEIAKRTGMLREVVEADIRSGKIGQKEIADILKVQADTGKAGAETAETLRKTEEARKATAAYTFYKDNPEAFARLHNIPLDQARAIVSDPDNYKKYQETSGPTAYADEAGYAQAKREGYTGSREDWKKIRPGAETIDEYTKKKEIDAAIAGDRRIGEKYFEENKDARDAYQNLQTVRKMQQDLHDDDMITGPLSFAELKGRQIFAKLTGRPDADVSNTNAFNAYRNQVVVQLSKDLKGATTEGDRELLEKAAGGNEMTPAELRRFIILQDIGDQRRIESKKQQAAGFRESDPKRYKQMLEGVPDYPPPNKKIREDMAAKPGLVKMVQENPDEEVDFPRLDATGRPMIGKNGKPKVETMTVKEYAEKQWGPGGYEHIRKLAKKD